MFRRALKSLFALLLLAVSQAAPAAADEMLTTAQLLDLFPGHFQAVVRGNTVKFIATATGQLVGRLGRHTDEGRWSVRNGQLCIMMKEWTQGRTSCSAITGNDGWLHGKGVSFRPS
jgi:hypothetical protein